MKLQTYKTLWGHEGDFALACEQAALAGFEGIEGPMPDAVAERQQWRALLDQYGLDFIAEICTAGSYVPDRSASLGDHLESLALQLRGCTELSPRFVTCLGGCDAWEESVSVQFFSEAMALATDYGVAISFETHRGRSLFNPWVTRRVCEQLPALRLTCDFSHWCVVCERLLEGEEDTLEAILPRAYHVHARVGYDQGPQVPDPTAARYADAVNRHWQWWQAIWKQQLSRGVSVSTMTPEFGPDGYQAIDVTSDQPAGDLVAMNRWMADQARSRFAAFTAQSQEAR